MTITVAPTLAVMARVYAQSLQGGQRSDRFRAYVDAASSGAPIHGFNPMTSQPVAETIGALLAIDAEDRLAAVANETAEWLGRHKIDDVMHITVATPGMWTDRLATEVEHRLLANDPGALLWWCGEPVGVRAFACEVAGQTVRLILQRRAGPPKTLADAVAQEGRALGVVGEEGRRDAAAAEALLVLADDPSLATKVAFLYGDEAARAMGFTPLGLGDRVGARHAIALATS